MLLGPGGLGCSCAARCTTTVGTTLLTSRCIHPPTQVQVHRWTGAQVPSNRSVQQQTGRGCLTAPGMAVGGRLLAPLASLGSWKAVGQASRHQICWVQPSNMLVPTLIGAQTQLLSFTSCYCEQWGRGRRLHTVGYTVLVTTRHHKPGNHNQSVQQCTSRVPFSRDMSACVQRLHNLQFKSYKISPLVDSRFVSKSV